MAAPAAPIVPSRVHFIGFVHIACGVMNLLTLVGLALYAVLFSLPTLGISFLACCPMAIIAPVAGLELYSGIRHVQKDHRGLSAPKMTSFAELATILGCGVYSFIGGVLTLVLMADPEVAEYYAARSAEPRT